MSPLARIRQAAACSAFGFFAGVAVGAMGLAVGAAGVALMAPISAVAATAPATGANTSLQPGQATAATSAAVAQPQPTPAQATAATSAAQAQPQPTPAQATAATSAAQASPQPTPGQATAATSAAQALPQPTPGQATAATSAAQALPQPTPGQATAGTSAAQPSSQLTPAQGAATLPAAAATSIAAQAVPQPVQLAPNAAAQIARSALLTIEGTATADALQLSIRRVSDKSLVSSDDVTVSVDGKNQSVTHEKGGAYELPINDLRGDGARDVDVTVAHDGIREIVSGKVSVAEASSTQSLLRDHKQVAWWILNIVIILIAATAISRRKG